MNESVLLVDGHGLAYRAYYALPELHAPDGTPTNVLVGFMNTFLKIVDEWKPGKIAVIFDESAPTFRHKQYEAYKATRKPMPEDMRPQIPLLKELLGSMGICVYSLAGFEADDILASTSLHWAAKGEEVLLFTADKDMLQILGPHIRILRPKKGIRTVDLFDEAAFRKEYPFSPSGMVDYLALVGDASDNVPGVPGIGDKGARKLLEEYANMDAIYTHLDSLKPGLRSKLEKGKESAYLSQELVTLCKTCEVPEELFDTCTPRDEELENLCRELGMEQTLGKIYAFLNLKPSAEVNANPVSRDFCDAPLEELLEESVLALFCSMEDSGKYSCVLGSRDGKQTRLEAENTIFPPVLQRWAREKGTFIVPQYKELCRNFFHTAPLPDSVWDLQIAHYLLHPDRSQKAYPELFADFSNPKLGELWAQYGLMQPEITSLELGQVMRGIDLPLCPVLVDMEKQGVRADRKALQELEGALCRRLEEIEENVETAGGMKLNLNSPKQVGHLLFDVLGLPPVKKTKTGYSTSTPVLEVLSALPGGEIPRMILEHRELAKMQSGFVQPFLDLSDNETGKICTTFEHTSTGTGRLSSTHPNFQNLPLYGEWAHRFRSALMPLREDACYVAADYSQIELRILAHLSREKSLLEAFNEGRDVHSETGARIFGVSPEDVSPEMRRQAKMVNFGLLYGMGGYGLADRLNISRGEAQKLVDTYFSAFPGIQEYLRESAEEAKKKGYTTTLFGRRRPLREVTTVEGRGGGALKRVAVNTPLQGTAADIARLALVAWNRKIRKEGLAMPLVLQVHDSLVVEVSREESSRATELLCGEMEKVVALSVPLKAEAKTGNTFGDL